MRERADRTIDMICQVAINLLLWDTCHQQLDWEQNQLQKKNSILLRKHYIDRINEYQENLSHRQVYIPTF